ncbi:MAG: T9SS type A sorting domain-containing protein, partial [Bacteroidetes bacterium]|nr:T9SS type A sorting domain-containing protein [Bacteroidota bacterium]
YTVVLTATGPGGMVTETKVDYILIPVGLDNETTGAYIVYPNPVTNTLQIQFPDKQKRVLILTNVTGNQLFETTSEDIESHLDMSKYKSGIYWLTIREKDEVVARVKVVRK